MPKFSRLRRAKTVIKYSFPFKNALKCPKFSRLRRAKIQFSPLQVHEKATRNQPAGLVGRRSARFWTPTDQGKPAEIILYPRWWLSNGTNHWPGVNRLSFGVGRPTDGRVPGGARSVWHAGLTKLPIVSMFFSRLGPIGARPGSIQTPKQHRSLIFFIYISGRNIDSGTHYRNGAIVRNAATPR